MDVHRQHLWSLTFVPEHGAFDSHVANEGHPNTNRSLHTEMRFQAVGISTQCLQNPIFAWPESANSDDRQVERLSSTRNAGKKFPAVENVSGFIAQASVRLWAF